jgi:hypothetical protein
MKNNYVATKKVLKRLNNLATREHGRSLVDEFFDLLPSDIKLVVTPVLPMDYDWHRCSICWSQTEVPVWLDIRGSDLHAMQTVEECKLLMMGAAL